MKAVFLILAIVVGHVTTPLQASWHDDVLVIVSEPGCLYLGDGATWTWLGCDEAIYRLAPSGVDQAYIPMQKELILVRDGRVVARLAVP